MVNFIEFRIHQIDRATMFTEEVCKFCTPPCRKCMEEMMNDDLEK